MARTPAAPAAPSTAKELKDLLWKSADKLRGSLDASQYKDIVLGLVFLKYVSDAFEERREQIREELIIEGYDEATVAETLEDRDEYTGSQVFWVPQEARWSYLAAHAKGTPDKSTGELVDDAMRRLMEENKSLAGTLPMVFNRSSVDMRRLSELIDLLNGARFTGAGATKARDLLGEVYEYFLEKFARAEGKRGGEFYTPAGVVRVLVEVLRPTSGRVYDPCCGSGGMFVQAEKFLESHHRSPGSISVYGQELNERTWRMAKMNLAIHGILGNLGPTWGDTFARDLHPDLKADVVMANPPFNIKDWARREDDARWAYGVPPAGNANYAWLQHILSKLTPDGQAGVVMANGSMSSNSGGEGQIRAEMVEADVVSCMVALPTQLFRSTGIPVCVWFLAKNKGASGGDDGPPRPDAVHRRPQPRPHGRPRRARPERRRHRQDRGHLRRLARHRGRVRRRPRLLPLRPDGGDQGRRLRPDPGPLRRHRGGRGRRRTPRREDRAAHQGAVRGDGRVRPPRRRRPRAVGTAVVRATLNQLGDRRPSTRLPP